MQSEAPRNAPRASWLGAVLVSASVVAGTLATVVRMTDEGGFRPLLAGALTAAGAVGLRRARRVHAPVVSLCLVVLAYLGTGARFELALLWWPLVVALATVAPQARAGLAIAAGVGLWAAASGLLYALGVPDPWPPLAGATLGGAFWAPAVVTLARRGAAATIPPGTP